MDPYSSPYTILNNSPYNPFPHSLLSTRESFVVYTTIFRESLISGEGGEVRLTIRGREACNTMTLTTSPEDSTVQKWQITWVQLGS